MLNLQFKSLMSNILREKSGSYITEQLFSQYPTLIEILNATEEELTQISGIGLAKARVITSALQLARTLTIPSSNPTIIRTPKDSFDLLKWEMMHLKHEEFRVIYLNTRNHVISVGTLGIGSLSSCTVHVREVLLSAVKRSSASIICGHNHPSGDPLPSECDLEFTKRLVDAAELLQISVLDSIVIGHECFISLREQGYMS